MPLNHYRREKLVILPHRSAVYQAARAMADNHIGAVLVSRAGELAGIVTDRDIALAVAGEGRDPRATTLEEVMSEGVAAIPVSADYPDVAALMRDAGVRRVAVVEDERLVGLITLDDMVMAEVPPRLLREVVHAQLVDAEAPLKPAGVHPATRVSRPTQGMRALQRAQARARQVEARVEQAMADASGLDRERAGQGFRLVACLLCRRLAPAEALHTIAQLPSRMQPELATCAVGPDRSITSAAIRDEISRSLGLDAAAAAEFVVSALGVLNMHISPGQMAEVRQHLPEDLRALFPERRAA